MWWVGGGWAYLRVGVCASCHPQAFFEKFPTWAAPSFRWKWGWVHRENKRFRMWIKGSFYFNILRMEITHKYDAYFESWFRDILITFKLISHDDFLFSYCAHLFLMVYTCFYKRIEKLGWRVKSGERECVWFYGWGANGVGLGNSQEGDFPPLLAEFDIDCPAIIKVLGPCLNKTTFTARQMLKDMQEVQDGEILQQNFSPATLFCPKSGIGFFPQQVVAFRIRDAPNSWSSCCCCCFELALHVSAADPWWRRGYLGDSDSGSRRDHGIPARVSAAIGYIGRQTFAARSLLLLLLLPLHKNSNFASGQRQTNNEPKCLDSRLAHTHEKSKMHSCRNDFSK